MAGRCTVCFEGYSAFLLHSFKNTVEQALIQEGSGMNMCTALEKLMDKGREEGREEGKQEIIRNMLKYKMPPAEIAMLTGVAIEVIEKMTQEEEG